MRLSHPSLFSLRPADEQVLFSFANVLAQMPSPPSIIAARIATWARNGYRINAARSWDDPDCGVVVFITAYKDMTAFPLPNHFDWQSGVRPTEVVGAWKLETGEMLGTDAAQRALETLAINSSIRYHAVLRDAAERTAHLWTCIVVVIATATALWWTAAYGLAFFQEVDPSRENQVAPFVATAVILAPVFIGIGVRAFITQRLLQTRYRSDYLVRAMDIAVISA